MRYREILREYHYNQIPESREQEAKRLGFDTSKIWFHGSNHKFTQFELQDRGDNELGKGIYLTGHWSTAIAFGDIIYDCYIRNGPIYDRNKQPSDEDLEKMHAAYVKLGGKNERYLNYKYFYDDMKISYRSKLPSMLIAAIGYIGAVDEYSQIKDQIVIFDPHNVFVGVANPAGEWGDRR